MISLIISIISCNSKKNKPNKDIQEIFKIKGNVKEIQEKIITKYFYYFSITTFDRDGNPIETKEFDKKGNIKSTEPWTRSTEEELNKIKPKKIYDKQRRLIKQIENYNGESFETEYKYNKTGKKTVEIKKFGDRNIQSSYDSNGFLKEVITSVLSDNELYWQSKEKYIYNKNHYLIEKHIYRVPDENNIAGKDLYEYDNIGSLIKTTTYYNGNKIPEVKNRKIIYY